MDKLFEYGDILNSPIEAFYFGTRKYTMPVEPHWHYFVEIIYILEGVVSVNCNHNKYILKPDEMIFIPPQALHSIYTVKKEQADFAVIKFDANRLSLPGNYLPKTGSFLRILNHKTDMPVTFTQETLGNFGLRQFFEDCISEIERKQYGYDAYVETMLSQLMIKLLRIWHSWGYNLGEEKIGESGDDSIHDIIMYIEQHSHENISVTHLAEMCSMSYSYFAKVFHRLYGQSCKEYIEFVRLCKVENLLLFTDHDLNYISSETGFSDCSHLIRVFKRKYNMTPKQYRKACLENPKKA